MRDRDGGCNGPDVGQWGIGVGGVFTLMCSLEWVTQIREKPMLEWSSFKSLKECLKLASCVSMWKIQGLNAPGST